MDFKHVILPKREVYIRFSCEWVHYVGQRSTSDISFPITPHLIFGDRTEPEARRFMETGWSAAPEPPSAAVTDTHCTWLLRDY